MKDMMLHVEYHATRYGDDKMMLPPSEQTRCDALFAILRHAGAIGSLMELVDEERLGDTNINSLYLMMTNLGELLNLLTEAGMTIIHEDEPFSEAKPKEGYADTNRVNSAH